MARRKSPFLAGILSIIPGLGQLYNEQFVKGFGILFGLGVGFLFMVVLPGLSFVGIGRSDPLSWALDPFTRGFNAVSLNNGAIFLPIAYVLVVAPIVWLYSLFDAIFTARRLNDENGLNQAAPRYMPNAPTTGVMPASGDSPATGGTPATATASVPQGAPMAPAHGRPRRVPHDPGLTPREAVIWGIGLVALGLLGLAATLDGALWTIVSRGWPLVLIVGGAYFVWSEQNRKNARQQAGGPTNGTGKGDGR